MPTRVLALLFLVAPGDAQEPPAQQPTPPPIRVRVDRVNVGVTVTDSRGQFTGGLRREDFHVFDNGAEQPITSFLSVEERAQLVLLIECGPAVYFLAKSHFQAADALLASLSADDRVAIACFSKSPELVLDFTSDKEAARLALHTINFKLGYAELNLSASLASTLEWLAPLPGKKSIALLSTGLDTSPQENWQRVRQKLETSDTRILAVSLFGDYRKPAKRKKLSPDERAARAYVKQGIGEADKSLRELSAATGGRVYFPKNTKEFERAYAEIAQLVRNEYSLAFTPPAFDGQLHAISVKVKQSHRVDHRQAYVAPLPDPK